jgi:hypothetical protein
MQETGKLTPSEAWEDFVENVLPSIPTTKNSTLKVAKATHLGRVRDKNGNVKTLGLKRIKAILETYAPGRYQFHEGEPWFEINKP